MPYVSQTASKLIENTALAYASFGSPISTDPVYVAGRNVLTSLRGYAERRPGLSAPLEATPTTFTNIQNIFVWTKWGGAHICMLSQLNASGFAEVWKLEIGVDPSFVKLWTSAFPDQFDFINANDTCYFGNATDQTNMRKYSGTGSVTQLWGIAAPTSLPTTLVTGNSEISNYAGLSATLGGWSNPTNAQGAPNATYATKSGAGVSHLGFNTYGFVLPAGSEIAGIQLTITGHGADAVQGNRAIRVGLTKDSVNDTGIYFTAYLNQTTDTDVVIGGNGNLWNTTWTEAEVENLNFGLRIYNVADPQTNALSIDSVKITVFYNAANSGINQLIGFHYRYTYGNSVTGHESSPSEISNCLDHFTNRAVSIVVTGSTDPQVDQLHVYRTPDGGSLAPEEMQEIQGSPFANASATVSDITLDSDLKAKYAPPLRRNDPPPPSRGFISYAGRIWMFKDNRSFYTGYEEIGEGVPEESVPGGLDGNEYVWAAQVKALAEITDAHVILQAIRMDYINGDTLDSFHRDKLLSAQGTRSQRNVTGVGGALSWLDTASQVWMSEGGEVGLDIRDDLETINHLQSQLAIHKSGASHWLLVLDGGRKLLYPLDLDRMQWMPPWDFDATAICSGETATGEMTLLAAHQGKVVRKLVPASYNDNGVPYAAYLQTNLYRSYPEGQPDLPGSIDHVAIERDDTALSDVKLNRDDDPETGTFVSLMANESDPPNREASSGDIIEKWYRPVMESSVARRVALRFDWPAEDKNFKLFSFEASYYPPGQ